MIKADKLSAGYGKKTVLKELSFSLPKLRTTTIVGPGGSGKSTLLKILTGCHSETILWQKGSFTVPEQTLAYLPQKPFKDQRTLFQVLAQEDTFKLGISWLLNCWKISPKASDVLLKHINKPFIDLPYELQRLAQFSIAMNDSNQVLLLDEPDAGIRPREQLWFTKKLQNINNSKTIVIVTHNLAFAYKIADYVVFMLDGEIIEAAEKKDFFNNPQCLRTKQFIEFGS
jgi:ABC-type cobalamin/Fe3+-siderophores transport system ATPase subunit